MLKSYKHDLQTKAFEGLYQYKRWCTLLKQVYARAVWNVKKYYFIKLHTNSVQFNQVRAYYYGKNRRLIRAVFDRFKFNSVLTKYELKRRLRTRAQLSFLESYIVQYTFYRWKKRSVMIVKLDSLDEQVELLLQKDAFLRLRSWAFPYSDRSLPQRLSMIRYADI